MLAVVLWSVACADKTRQSSPTDELVPVQARLAPMLGERPLPQGSVASGCEQNMGALKNSLDGLANTVSASRARVGLRRVDDWLLALDNTANSYGLYEYVHPEEQVREESMACMRRLNELLSDFILSRELYSALRGIDADVLDADAQRYLEHLLREFKRSGANLDDSGRSQVRRLREEILKAGQQYALNIREGRLSMEVSLDELAGLPSDYIESRLTEGAREITVSTDYPDYQPIMQYAQSTRLRLRLLRLFLQRAHVGNTEALKTLLETRFELANLLGYQNYAEYTLEYQMAKTPARVKRFIDDISQLAMERSHQDYAILLSALRKTDPRASSVGRWQQHFLANTVKQQRFSLDPKIVRSYFRYQRVKRGIFQLARELFDVRIEAVPGVQTWHEDVEAYDLYDGPELIGRFYLDMHPRANKYQHAAHFGIRTGVLGRQRSVAALVCNFPTDPTHKDGAYMEHTQVETFLHEFGHLLHSMLGGRQRWSTLSGIATEHDFVEAPSQMLEEWIWDEQTLQSFAHNDAAEPIPSEIVQQMNEARDFGRGLWVRNQMYYAALALHYYTNPPQDIDLHADMVRLQNRYSPFKYVEDTYFYANFGHLYGYAASYYTYMWSLVIATDLFAQFREHGLNNPEITRRYKETILKPGGTRDAAVLVRDFLGRDYDTKAFADTLRRN